MTNTTIATDFNKSLDIKSGFSAKIALNLEIVIDIFTKLGNVILAHIFNSKVGIYAGCCNNVACCFTTYAVDICESDFDSLISGQVYT